eukprot:5688661-Prymnesium_polylepis.1
MVRGCCSAPALRVALVVAQREREAQPLRIGEVNVAVACDVPRARTRMRVAAGRERPGRWVVSAKRNPAAVRDETRHGGGEARRGAALQRVAARRRVPEYGPLGRVEDRVRVLGELEGQPRLLEDLAAVGAHVQVDLRATRREGARGVRGARA